MAFSAQDVKELREIAKEDSEIGNYVAETMASGKLVKDEITYQLIEERLARDDCKNGFIIDGFPRNLEQAIEYINDDELVEVTPKNIRLRKKILDSKMRERAARKSE